MKSLLRYVRYGLRAMMRSPGLVLVAMLSSGLGIGANTAIFSLLDTVMLKSLRVRADRAASQHVVQTSKGDSDAYNQIFCPDRPREPPMCRRRAPIASAGYVVCRYTSRCYVT
jgi:hypothetical protein